jgi:tRNA (guanosine-2'-O-)-methyltransferase
MDLINLDYRQKKALWDYFQGFLSENKKQLFAEKLKFRTSHLTIAIEDAYYEQNSSAIIRSAECFGVQSLHIIENENKYKIAQGVSRGAEKWLDLYTYNRQNQIITPLEDCLNNLKSLDYQIIATTPHPKGVNLEEMDLSKKTALFFGGEKFGISTIVQNRADGFVKIPMVGFTESLNIAVSAGIILYQLTQKIRLLSDNQWLMDEEEKMNCQLNWAVKSVPNGAKIADYFFEKL